MAFAPGPAGELLAGEQELASYRGRELVLTGRRVVHRGRGDPTGHVAVRLAQVTAVALGRRRMFQPVLLVVPGVFLLLGAALAASFGTDEAFWVMLPLVLATLPLAWLRRPFVLEIIVPGHCVRVHAPPPHRESARAFVQAVEAARAALEDEAGPVAATTTAFGG